MGYDSKNVRKELRKNNYTPIIPINKRNSKQEPPEFTEYEIKKYNERIRIEHSYAHIKNCKSIPMRQDKNEDTFFATCQIAIIISIVSKI